jgi:hypothetical protein
MHKPSWTWLLRTDEQGPQSNRYIAEPSEILTTIRDDTIEESVRWYLLSLVHKQDPPVMWTKPALQNSGEWSVDRTSARVDHDEIRRHPVNRERSTHGRSPIRHEPKCNTSMRRIALSVSWAGRATWIEATELARRGRLVSVCWRYGYVSELTSSGRVCR